MILLLVSPRTQFSLPANCIFRKRRFEAPFGPQTWNCPHFKVQANYEVGLIPLNSTQNFKEKMFHQLL